jgi:type III pantothenate kinase
MLLAVDVGNTNITFGVFDGTKMITRFHFTVKVSRTSDEYGSTICDILERKGVSSGDINQVIVASVVPKIMYSLNSGIIKYLDCQPVIVGAGIKTGIRIETANPKEVGPDRIVDAVAAHTLYGGPVIVADYGTATTYDLVTEAGAFQGGVISPGVRISANALWNDTANLPEIEIKCPDNVVAKDTITAMQAGLFLGTVGQSKYIINKIKEESGLSDIKVVATGGLGKMISDYTDEIDIYDSDLTLKGLQIIFDKQNIKAK